MLLGLGGGEGAATGGGDADLVKAVVDCVSLTRVSELAQKPQPELASGPVCIAKPEAIMWAESSREGLQCQRSAAVRSSTLLQCSNGGTLMQDRMQPAE